MQYYVIYMSEDGNTSLYVMRKDTLLKRIADEYWGKCKIYQLTLQPGNECDCVSLESGAGLYIIAGESVIPKPKTRVVEWEI